MQTTTVSVSAGDIYRNGRDRDRNCGGGYSHNTVQYYDRILNMEQRRAVQRLITQSGFNPRRSTRRTRTVPIETATIPIDRSRVNQVMSTVQPMIVEEVEKISPGADNIQQVIESVEQLVVINEDADDITGESLIGIEDDEDLASELRDRRAAYRQKLEAVTKADLLDFYRKFFRGIPDMTLGHLKFVYSLYIQLDDSRLNVFMANMRDLFESDTVTTLSIYGPDVVLIDPSIRTVGGIDTLIIAYTNVAELPAEIANMPDINTVILTRNDRLRSIPDKVERLVVYQE